MPDSNPDMRTNADGSVTLIVRGVHPLHAALLDDGPKSGPRFFLTKSAHRALTDSFIDSVFRPYHPPYALYDAPPLYDIDEHTMTAIYRVTDEHGEEHATPVTFMLTTCPCRYLAKGEDECPDCHGRMRVPTRGRPLTDVEIVQRSQSLAQRKGA